MKEHLEHEPVPDDILTKSEVFELAKELADKNGFSFAMIERALAERGIIAPAPVEHNIRITVEATVAQGASPEHVRSLVATALAEHYQIPNLSNVRNLNVEEI